MTVDADFTAVATIATTSSCD
jgi:hypothetical protein